MGIFYTDWTLGSKITIHISLCVAKRLHACLFERSHITNNQRKYVRDAAHIRACWIRDGIIKSSVLFFYTLYIGLTVANNELCH